MVAYLDMNINEHKKGDYIISQIAKDSTIFILLKRTLAFIKNEVPDAELNNLTA